MEAEGGVAMRALVLLLGASLAAGCGDDDGRLPAIDGGPDIGSDSGVDSGPATAFTIRMRFLDAADDSPLADVKLAVDTGRGRFEGTSDTAGEVTLDVDHSGEAYSAIAALEGYTMAAITGFGLTESQLGREDGDVRVVYLAELAPDVTDPVRVVVSATGVPAGGRWCSGVGRWITVCFGETGRFQQNGVSRAVADEVLSDYVTGYAFDASGTLVDFDTADYVVDAVGNRNASIAFDGALDDTPVTRDITLTLPAAPESPFRTMTLDAEWQGWAAVVEPGTYLSRGALTNVQIMPDRVTFTVSTFPVAGDDLVWALAAYASFTDPIRTFRWFSAEPTADTLEFLDVPRVTAGDRWDGEVTWTAPAADVDNYVVDYYNNADRAVARMRAPGSPAQLPALPTGYDPEVSFPFPDAAGYVQVRALRGDIPPDDTAPDPYRVDGELATSARHPIVF
jgi:hypothetical protein